LSVGFAVFNFLNQISALGRMQASTAALGGCPVRSRAPRHVEGRLRVDMSQSAGVRTGPSLTTRVRRCSVLAIEGEAVVRSGDRRVNGPRPSCRSAR